MENNNEKTQLVEDFLNKLDNNLLGETDVPLKSEVIKKIIEFMVDELSNVPINIRRFYLNILKREKEIFNFIDAELFLKIIRHLRFVGERKREKHVIGANIIVFTDYDAADRQIKSAIPFSNEHNNVCQIELKFFDDKKLENIYKHVNPQRSFFAYYYNRDAHTYTFMGIKDFKIEPHKMPDLFNQMKSVCTGNTLGFSVEGGTSCIRIFYRNAHRIDYALSEASGSWEVKFTKQINDLIAKIKLEEDDRKKLVEQVINLSYSGIGSMIIITDNIDKFSLNDTGIAINLNLANACDNFQFCDFASLDGALIIDKSNGEAKIKKIGVILSPQTSLSDGYAKLINGNSCGARHEKAARYACENIDDYIIVISENRTVSFLHGENPIYWRDREISSKNDSIRRFYK